MTQNSILDGIRVASPCPANWDEMVGDDRVRFCSGCRKDVYNIGPMTTSEALALIVGQESTPCVRFYRRSDGTVLTSDCPVGSGRVRRRRLQRVAGLGAVGLALMATGASAIGVRRAEVEPMPSGPGVTLDDWIDWAMVTVGLRARPVLTAGSPTPPAFTAGGLTPPAPRCMEATDTPDVPLSPGPECTPGFRMGEADAVPGPALGRPASPPVAQP